MSDDERFYRGVELEPSVVVELARLRARRRDMFAPAPGRDTETQP